MPKSKPKLLHSAATSVTGARLTVDETSSGLRTLYLDDNIQSEVQVNRDGSLSMAQPLELVQIMSLLSLSWIADVEAPSVLLIGIGGGSIARVLAALMPPAGKVHSLDLEPEVVQAAIDFFGLPNVAPRCTAVAGDGAEHMKEHCRKRSAAGYDVLILDAFTSDGLADSTQRQSTLDDAAGCLSARGILLVNLHTGDLDDPDYYVARRVLRALCARFGAVYSVLCGSTQNLIAVCHQGEFLEAGLWEAQIAEQLARKEVLAACASFSLAGTMSRFDYVGGKDDPMEDEAGVGNLEQ